MVLFFSTCAKLLKMSRFISPDFICMAKRYFGISVSVVRVHESKVLKNS